MSFQQLTVYTHLQYAEIIESYLSDSGALSITFQDAEDVPQYEPALGTHPLWPKTIILALFDLGDDITPVMEQLKQDPYQQYLYASPQREVLPDKEWSREWMQYFAPQEFGQGLWIVPSSHTMPADPNAVYIHLDPGLAFGTGTHPTTALCLEWLSLHRDKLRSAKTLIDYGTGSGILAIAAARLGAAHVIAVDYDDQALLATKENAEKNGVLANLTIVQPGDVDVTQADIIVANILANPLMSLAPLFAEKLNPRGDLILSGLLFDQLALVKACYEPYFNSFKESIREDWVCLTAVRND